MPINSPDIFNSVGDAVVSGGGGGATTFLGLTDTPANYTGATKKFVRVNAGGTALIFSDISFIEDSDTPASYVGQGGKLVAVNSTPDALEFIDQTFLGDTDTPSSYTGEASKIVQVKSDESGLEFVTASTGDKVLNVKTSLTTGQVQHMAYNDTPITLVAGVVSKIIQPLSITLITNYATGFAEASSNDGVVGWDASNSGSTMKWAGIRDLMDGKATGTYTWTPTIGGTYTMDFSVSGKDFQIWSSANFNGNWTMDVYLTYVILDA
jgi:hypothetical protein